MLIRQEHFVHLFLYTYSHAHAVLHSRKRERGEKTWLNSLENHIHSLHRQQPAILSSHSSLSRRGLQGARDPLTEFTSTSKSSPHRSNHSTSHTRLILTRFSSSIVGRLLTSTLARSSSTSEVWTCRLRLSAWRNGMRQSETMGYAKKVEYKLVFREREV